MSVRTASHRRTAVRDTIPVAISVAPFALVVGAAAAQIGVPLVSGLVATGLLFSGGAHYAALDLLASGAGTLTVLAAVTLVNARLLLYSAALEPRFRHQPTWFRWLGPALIVDQTYLMVLASADLDDVGFRRYWVSVGTGLMGCWVGLVALGAVVGPLLPAGSPLEAAGVVVMAGMLATRLTAPRPVVVAAAALLVAVAAAPLPGGVGLLAGIAAGLAVGALLDRSRP